jgi:putative membrane protein
MEQPMSTPQKGEGHLFNEASSELAARRTGMSFQRTRMAADRTLMAVIRTSLSLLSFGFTINKVFQGLKEGKLISHAASGHNFGIALVVIGMLVLLLGIVYHGWFMHALRCQRRSMADDGLVHGESPFPPSMTLVTAVLLFALGVAVAISMVFRIGPFS